MDIKIILDELAVAHDTCIGCMYNFGCCEGVGAVNCDGCEKGFKAALSRIREEIQQK